MLRFLIILVAFRLARAGAYEAEPIQTQEEQINQEDVSDHSNSLRMSGLEALQSNLSALTHTVLEFREILERQLYNMKQHSTSKSSDKTGRRHYHRYNHHSHHHRKHGHWSGRKHHDEQGEEAEKSSLVSHAIDFLINYPKLRNPKENDFAVCDMRSRTDIHGAVYFFQNKNSDTLYMYVFMAGFNSTTTRYTSRRKNSHGRRKSRRYHSSKTEKFFYRFSVHENPDLSSGCDSVGPPLNPHQEDHEDDNSEERDLGDFGNLASNSYGIINELVIDESVSLRGNYSIIGKPLVVHAAAGGQESKHSDPSSTSSRHSANPLACCVIEVLNIAETQQKHDDHDHDYE